MDTKHIVSEAGATIRHFGPNWALLVVVMVGIGFGIHFQLEANNRLYEALDANVKFMRANCFISANGKPDLRDFCLEADVLNTGDR